MLLKCYTQNGSKFGKLCSGHSSGQSVFIPVLKKENATEYSSCHTIALISHSSKIMLKSLQARLQEYVNHELPMFKLDLEKVEEPEIKLLTSIRTWKKERSSRKTFTSALLTMLKPLTVWITTNCGKFLKRQTTLPASWETSVQAKKQWLESHMELQTGSKLGKEYIKAVYHHPAYLTYTQSTSCEMSGWMNHKLESRLLGEI